jgi:hypothetical protein
MKIHYLLFVALIFASFAYATPSITYAHGGASLTFSATTTEGYIVDIDVPDGYLQAKSFTRINFALFKDAARTKSANYTDMWVRIEKKENGKRGQTLFAGPIAKTEFGGQGFGYYFPDGGEYTLSIRYNDATKDSYDGETVAEAEFPFTVLRSTDENKFSFGMEFWIGLGAGVFLVLVLLIPFLMRGK